MRPGLVPSLPQVVPAVSAAWVAPAAWPVTVLHYPAEDGTQTVCALPFDEAELWVPVERREGDRVCFVCESRGRCCDVG